MTIPAHNDQLRQTDQVDQQVPAAPAAVLQLNYVSAVDKPPLCPPWRSRWYKGVLACWGIPFGLGVIVACIFMISRADYLLPIGFFIIVGGIALSAVGSVLILLFVTTRWGSSVNRKKEVVIPAILMLLLLASNYVTAFLLICAATSIDHL